MADKTVRLFDLTRREFTFAAHSLSARFVRYNIQFVVYALSYTVQHEQQQRRRLQRPVAIAETRLARIVA